ncbi:MAG TPA: ABC transporter ATP-binding protein [Trueperaceae bacterium]|nr:ABC transporter ATP-binding protein [Trueperaceae bacterium]
MTTEQLGSATPLVVSELTVRLAGVSVLEDVTFTLAPGEVALLVGANGAGKSTLIRAVVGLLPSRGDIAIFGRPNRSLTARSKFVFSPDDPALYEDLTLREHVRFTSVVYGRPEADERALVWLERFGLTARLDEFPGTHSRGMRQKLALSLALGLEMPLTILDEPFNGLDIASQERLAAGLQERGKAGGAVLLTGHQRELETLLEARRLDLVDGQLQA